MNGNDNALARAFQAIGASFNHSANLVTATGDTVDVLHNLMAKMAAADPTIADPDLIAAMAGEDTIIQTLLRYERAMREQADRARVLRRYIARQHRAAQLRAND